MSELAPSEKMMMPTPMPAGNSESPVLMLTDIGRDIDDTVALIALANYQREGLLRLVGVVATGGVGKHRAVLARDWLRKLGYEDKDVVLAACPHAGEETCFHIRVPPGSVEQANLFEGGREGHEADMIRSLATKHAGKLQIFATAPLSSLAKAIESEEGLGIVKRGLKTLHIQGQATVNANGLLEPDFRAFNLREDEPAAIDVFKKLQQDVPFRLLGKNAAYRVSLTLEDFKGWDVAHGGEDCDILRRNVKLGLAGLKQ